MRYCLGVNISISHLSQKMVVQDQVGQEHDRQNNHSGRELPVLTGSHFAESIAEHGKQNA